ncbi:MAG TPA: recombinase family protein [Puia sp.]|nr:recombinase family protein [Puia sp.]
MQVADLYIRVSTDEQADKGYSQRNQEEMLRKYCNLHAIQVRKVIYEDHSAKTFNRPKWKALLLDILREDIHPEAQGRGKPICERQHEPLISESLFYEVQDILDGRGRRYCLDHGRNVAAITAFSAVPAMW